MNNKKDKKSNPYVYPYLSFYDLSYKKIKIKKKGSRKITTSQLEDYIKFHQFPTLSLKNKNLVEKIFSIFLSEKIRFGPKKYIFSLKDYWINKINFFIKKNKPLNFVILGFPFKIPVLLKTNRVLPDMGEVLSLKRLYDLCSFIEKIYKPGAKVNIITEEVFGTFNNMDFKELISYQNFLKFLVKKLRWNKKISFYPLSKIEVLFSNFNEIFQNKINELEKKFINGEKEFVKKYVTAYESLYRITNTKRFGLSLNYLMDVYNEKKEIKKNVVLKTRKLIEYYTHTMLIKYFAYLTLRDEVGFIEKVFPKSLMLSVSPKIYRLGIQPVGENCNKLPYHGVPVFHEKDKKFSIEYLIDLKRQNWLIEEIFYEEDGENKPFFYIKK